MERIAFDGMKVAGLCVRAPWQALWEVMPRTWQRLYERAGELESVRCGPFLNASLAVDGEDYLQLVGCPVNEIEAVPDGLAIAEIPAQTLLRHEHRGPLAEIAASFGILLDQARENGLDPGDFKLDLGYTPDGSELSHELYVGLRPETPWRWIRS